VTAAEQAALDYILANEGGDANVAGDRGGKTRCGISWRSYPGDPIFEMTDPAAIRARACDIYRKDYIAPLGIADVASPRVLAKVADFAVVAGVRRSVEALQRALNDYEWSLTVDGMVGQKTRHAVLITTASRLLGQLCRQHCLHFLRVAENPSQRKFLLGWTRRAMRLPE